MLLNIVAATVVLPHVLGAMAIVGLALDLIPVVTLTTAAHIVQLLLAPHLLDLLSSKLLKLVFNLQI